MPKLYPHFYNSDGKIKTTSELRKDTNQTLLDRIKGSGNGNGNGILSETFKLQFIQISDEKDVANKMLEYLFKMFSQYHHFNLFTTLPMQDKPYFDYPSYYHTIPEVIMAIHKILPILIYEDKELVYKQYNDAFNYIQEILQPETFKNKRKE